MKPKKIHFIAIGGCIMHSLAIHLHQLGHIVTGSDIVIYEPAKSNLQKVGILPSQMGWFQDKISQQIDQIVLGMAAKKDNVQLIKAMQFNLKIVSYPQYLFQCCKNKKRVVIAGTHGKTTTTGIILHVLNYLNINFDYLIGSQICGIQNLVRISENSQLIIIEGDQYFASPISPRSKFQFYKPHIAVITGIQWDHYNIFPTFKSYVNSFKKLCQVVEKPGTLFFDGTDSNLKMLIQDLQKNDILKQLQTIKYDQHQNQVMNQKTYLITQLKEKIPLEIFGQHNMKNLNVAKLVLKKLGVSSQQFYKAIGNFKGASKRLQSVFENKNIKIYRDFAHSPSKVVATIHAVKSKFPKRKLICCYQLATFSSLNKNFLGQYKDSLRQADGSMIFFNKDVCKLKKLEQLDKDFIMKSFNRQDIIIGNKKQQIYEFLDKIQLKNQEAILLLMSTLNFDNLDLKKLIKNVTLKYSQV